MSTTSKSSKLACKATIKKTHINVGSKSKVTQSISLLSRAPTRDESLQLTRNLESKCLSAESGFNLALRSFEKIFVTTVHSGVRPIVKLLITVRRELNPSIIMQSRKSFDWSVGNDGVITVEMFIDKKQLEEKDFLNSCPLETIQESFSKAPTFNQCVEYFSGVCDFRWICSSFPNVEEVRCFQEYTPVSSSPTSSSPVSTSLSLSIRKLNVSSDFPNLDKVLELCPNLNKIEFRCYDPSGFQTQMKQLSNSKRFFNSISVDVSNCLVNVFKPFNDEKNSTTSTTSTTPQQLIIVDELKITTFYQITASDLKVLSGLFKAKNLTLKDTRYLPNPTPIIAQDFIELFQLLMRYDTVKGFNLEYGSENNDHLQLATNSDVLNFLDKNREWLNNNPDVKDVLQNFSF